MANFKRGDRVEICCKDEGFKGVYYPATIISEISPCEYMVQHDTLLRDDELAPLREMVNPKDLRPVPPDVAVGTRGFEVDDMVDAFANEGWWVGKVVRKLGGRTGTKSCHVHFECNGETEKHALSDLRVHQDWIDGKWLQGTQSY